MPYTIAQGDTLSGIASKNNTTVQNLMALNPYIKDANKIYAGASLNLPSVPASNNSTGVVSATGITNSVPAQIPNTPKPTDYSGLITNGTATIDANRTSVDNSLPDYYKQYLDNLPKPVSVGDTYSKDYASSGIDQKTTDFNMAKSEFDAINAQIAGINAEAQSAKLAREQAGNAPGFVTSAEQAQIDRSLAIRALPLQVQALAAQAKMNNSQAILQQAQDHLDKVFQIHTADATAQYNYQTNLVKSVFDYATEQQKALLTAKQKEADQAFTTRQNVLNNAQSIAKSALDSGQSSLAGKILALDPSSSSYQTEVALLAGQVKQKPSSSIPGVILTPEQQVDPVLRLLASSAGGKPLTDTPLNQLNKGFTVLGQLGTLQSNIKDTNTGPLVGLFRGANPWDTNAQTIKAQLNAIVPNLARGIYGEVGVLTDNDIKIYSQTLPNLKSTEDLRNAVLYITLDQVAKSIGTTMKVQAAGGRDVSGFVEMYAEMQKSKDSIANQLNVQTTPQDKDIYSSVVSGGSSGGIGGFFSDIWKGLTGK